MENMEEKYEKSMGKKGSGSMGSDPMVPCLGKHSVAGKDSLYTKDFKGGQPAGMGSTKSYGTGNVQGCSHMGPPSSSSPMKKGKRMDYKG